ncbi:elongation factor P [Candidatus Falkowbacteria bacterium]|nr:elongation factor P [Candidatus Falkowbacteria bacterium]
MSINTLNDIKKGKVFSIDGAPWLVVEANFVRMQQRKPVMQTKLRNLINNKVLEVNYNPGDSIEEADLSHQAAGFLYTADGQAHFMNNTTYEEVAFDLDVVGDAAQYLHEGLAVDVLYFNDQPVSLAVPRKVELRVTQTVDGARGDTAQGKVTKPATLETGMEITVPLFIKEDDVVRINTETGEYVERVS